MSDYQTIPWAPRPRGLLGPVLTCPGIGFLASHPRFANWLDRFYCTPPTTAAKAKSRLRAVIARDRERVPAWRWVMVREARPGERYFSYFNHLKGRVVRFGLAVYRWERRR